MVWHSYFWAHVRFAPARHRVLCPSGDEEWSNEHKRLAQPGLHEGYTANVIPDHCIQTF